MLMQENDLLHWSNAMMQACVFSTALQLHAGANSSISRFDASYVYMLCLERHVALATMIAEMVAIGL